MTTAKKLQNKADKLEILQAQIQTDIKDIQDSFEGEIEWTSFQEATRRLEKKVEKFNKLASSILTEAIS